MLYIQITTFFGSLCEFKMSCLRPNCCAARKMWFQLFFFPKHPFRRVDGYCHPGACLSPAAVPGAGGTGSRCWARAGLA